MKMLQIPRSLLYFLEELEFTEAALAADALTLLLADPFQLMIGEWDEIFRKLRAARRQVIRADALVAVRNVQLDEPTLRVGGLLLVEAGMDRNSPFFRRFFRVAPSTFVRLGLRRQSDETLNCMVPELERLPESSAARAVGPELKERSGQALTALDARSQAKGARGVVGSEVEEWKEGVNRLRMTTYAELLRIAAEKGYSRAWAETFFRTESKGAPDEDEGSEPGGSEG